MWVLEESFDDFFRFLSPYTDVKSFIALSQIFEGVGEFALFFFYPVSLYI